MSFVEEGAAGRIYGHNDTDAEGNPTGGHVAGRGFRIDWQDGPLGRGEERIEPNGAFTEDVLRAVVTRFEYFQQSKFACRENALVITKLEEAIHWIQHRTRAREARGVEGTHEV